MAQVRIELPAGVGIGHWHDAAARTGCTVVVVPPGTVGSGEVRGGAPASRELALLDPSRTVAHVDAVVLTGGSAFGLGVADGVLPVLRAAGRGFPTEAGPVPIVPTMALFDLLVGDPDRWPTPAEGGQAARAALAMASAGPETPPTVSGGPAGAGPASGGPDPRATTSPGDAGPVPAVPHDVAIGAVGAGAGATVDKWRGRQHAVAGGLGMASASRHGVTVTAIVAVNAFGSVVGVAPKGASEPIVDPEEPHIAEVLVQPEVHFSQGDLTSPGDRTAGTNTTIGVVVTDALLDKVGCHLVAQGAHDGFARAIRPVHTRADGDAVVALATGAVDRGPATVDVVRELAVTATAAAIRAAVRAT